MRLTMGDYIPPYTKEEDIEYELKEHSELSMTINTNHRNFRALVRSMTGSGHGATFLQTYNVEHKRWVEFIQKLSWMAIKAQTSTVAPLRGVVFQELVVAVLSLDDEDLLACLEYCGNPFQEVDVEISLEFKRRWLVEQMRGPKFASTLW
jgi:hypothetical protein